MHIFIDETEYDKTSFIYGAIAISDRNVEEYRSAIASAREEVQSDPAFFQHLNIKNLKKSFHYTQDHREVKNRFISLMKMFTFECYFYIAHDIDSDKKKRSRVEYINSLDRFLRQRFQEMINYTWERDESLGAIDWPSHIAMLERYKQEDELLSVSDYSLGIFRKVYISEWDATGKTAAIRDYDAIVNKIRFIKDSHIKKPYTRRNPFVVDLEE